MTERFKLTHKNSEYFSINNQCVCEVMMLRKNTNADRNNSLYLRVGSKFMRYIFILTAFLYLSYNKTAYIPSLFAAMSLSIILRVGYEILQESNKSVFINIL